MAVLAPHRFTVGDFHRIAEAGVLRPEARVELLDGQIVDRAPIGPLHGGTVNRLARFFVQRSQDRWLTSIQNPLRMNPDSEPQPDLLLLRPRGDDYLDRHPVPDDVLLLIEVSDSTLEFDRNQKLPAYARAGVPEVWIIDLNAGAVEVYRDPHFLGFESKSVFRSREVARPMAFPDVDVAVADLLRRARS